jgi:hypothetical protein
MQSNRRGREVALAFTLKGGYSVPAGRCTRFVGEYADGSRITYTWSENRNYKPTAYADCCSTDATSCRWRTHAVLAPPLEDLGRHPKLRHIGFLR